MPNKQMIETHAGPQVALLVAGTGAALAQVIPGTGDFEKITIIGTLVAAIFWLVKQLNDEKKIARERDERYQTSLEVLVGQAVAAQHANQLATQANTTALSRVTETLDVIRASMKAPGSHR